MKQTASFISTYSADVFGVCSALFELGGMVIMHDASGCNSTYSTHDEPRWYDMESMVYISGLSEMEAIMGDDEKLISDVVRDAKMLNPNFIAVAGTPIPAMTGFDFEAAASVIEARTGIPSFGFATAGMETYIKGAGMALEAVVRRFAKRDIKRTERLSCNILGLTPLDFSINGEDKSVAERLRSSGFEPNVPLAMGCRFEELQRLGAAHVNLVVSAAGIPAARALESIFGTPYVLGLPAAGEYSKRLISRLRSAANSGASHEKQTLLGQDACKTRGGIAVIGEGVRSLALAEAIKLDTGKDACVVCAAEDNAPYLRRCDICAPDEDDIIEAISSADTVIADPLFKPIVPAEKRFIPLPHEAFSGRIFRKDIPDLVKDLGAVIKLL
mgnify:CR=1 FL=1